MGDWASTNNVAMQSMKVVYPNLINIKCYSHMIDWVGKNSGPRDQEPRDPLVTSVLWNLHFPIHSVLVLHFLPVQVTVVNAFHCHMINPAPSLLPTMFNKTPKGPTPQPTTNYATHSYCAN